MFPFQSPAHTPSVSSVRQASQSLITSHIKPSRFTHSSVSPVQQASSITSPVKPSSFTRSSVSPVWQGSSITSPVKPSSFIRSSVSPVRQASHSPSVTSPVKPSTFTRSSVSPIRSASHSPSLVRNLPISTSNSDSPTLILPPSQIRPVSNEQSLILLCPAQTSNSHLPLNLYLQKELIRHKVSFVIHTYPYLLYIPPPPLSEPSLSTLSTSTCHVNIREEADKEYLKNVERMKIQYAKRRQHQCNTYCAGDTVTVRVPKNEQSSTDMPCLLCYANEVRHDLYQLQ